MYYCLEFLLFIVYGIFLEESHAVFQQLYV
jgi:hypothetical protein